MTETALNITHDPSRRSWVGSANALDTEFPIQNLPFGLFRGSDGMAHGGVAIGDRVFDLTFGLAAGLFSGDAESAARAAAGPTLNPLLSLGREPASALRRRLSDLLEANSADRERLLEMADGLLLPMAGTELLLPAAIGQFTDMCASTFHIGRCRGEGEREQPIVPPVLKHLPVGYNGRASSVVVSGSPVRRPNGQWKVSPDDAAPSFGPEPWLDYELEMGVWIAGQGNPLGEPIAIADADQHIFGFCILNDWSARGIQMFESMLGPFLGKSFATTVSPWIVTAEALRPYRAAAFERSPEDPALASYLSNERDHVSGGYDIALEALVRSADMRTRGEAPMLLCQSNFRHMYWTWAQMLAHHSSNGCNLRAGDLIGSGTCSGPTPSAAGCLLETTVRSRIAWQLPTGEQRLYLEDGDEVLFRARAQASGHSGLGFGDCTGVVLSAP